VNGVNEPLWARKLELSIGVATTVDAREPSSPGCWARTEGALLKIWA